MADGHSCTDTHSTSLNMQAIAIFALCIASALAIPSNIDAQWQAKHAMLPMSLMTSELASIDRAAGECLQKLHEDLLAALLAAGAASRVCVQDSYDQVMQIHKDVYDSLVEAGGHIEEQVGKWHECGDFACKEEVLRAIHEIVVNNVKKNVEIVKTGVAAIAEEFPEDFQCTVDALHTFVADSKAALNAFVACIQATKY